MIRLHDIIDTVSAYNPDADLDIIRKAYVFAARSHQGQTRRSGEPYLVHPLEVAAILASMKLDLASITASLLHDTVEDTVATLEEVEELFGKEVMELVDGVSKLSKIQFKTAADRQAENFRKMILATAKDIRVILIKLADRLHNMRTLRHMPENRQVAIAQETLDIYAPIANRLGIQHLKVEFEDLCLKYLKPDVYKVIDNRISEIREKREKYITSVTKTLKGNLEQHNISADVKGRVKHYYSVWRKMERMKLPLDEIYDIIAFRIVVDSISKCYEALGMIHSVWRPVPGKFKDYIAMPKANNYQSLHTTVIGPEGERVEFQIRTQNMNETAEFGIAAHWKYKEGKLVSNKDEIKFTWLRRLMEWQNELSDSTEFLDAMKLDLFSEEVYIFTPEGDLKELPIGSTPLDFAYSVHTELGHRCTGAKVNSRIVPLKYRLRSGDTVEILTGKTQRPHTDWLNYVATSRAKAKIRQYLRNEEREKSVSIGKELLDKECSRQHLNFNKLLKSKELAEYVSNSSYENLDSVFAAIGYGKLSPRHVANLMTPQEENTKESMLEKLTKKISKPSGAVKVGGASGVLVSFAHCCNPVPGEPIVGYVTRGKGVTIHVQDCSRVIGLDPERFIDVQWEGNAGTHPVKMRIVCVDQSGLLANMTEAMSNVGADVSGASITTSEDKTANCVFEMRIKDLSHLRNVMKAIEKIKGVISVERIRQ